MKARKIIICVLATLSLSSVALAESGVYRYVNTLDGVNVRDKPSLSGKKKFALKCNERVELLEETAEKEKSATLKSRGAKSALKVALGALSTASIFRALLKMRRTFAVTRF